LATIPIFSSWPKAVPAGAGYVHRVRTGAVGFRGKLKNFRTVQKKRKQCHDGITLGTEDVPGLRQVAGWQTDIVPGAERTARHRWRRWVRFGSQAKA